jgi:hypothetical protein
MDELLQVIGQDYRLDLLPESVLLVLERLAESLVEVPNRLELPGRVETIEPVDLPLESRNWIRPEEDWLEPIVRPLESRN